MEQEFVENQDQVIDEQSQPAETPEETQVQESSEAVQSEPGKTSQEYDIAKDPRYQAVEHKLQEIERFQKTLLSDPHINAAAHRVLGMAPPQQPATPDQEISQLRAIARENPNLQEQVENKIWEIRQQQQQSHINQAVQQGIQAYLGPLMIKNQIMSDPQYEPVRPYADVVAELNSQGVPPQVAFQLIGRVLAAQNAANVQGGGNVSANRMGAGGNPNQARRPDFASMPLSEFDKEVKGFLDNI